MPPPRIVNASSKSDESYQKVISSIYECLSKLDSESIGAVYGIQAEIANLKTSLTSMLATITQCQESIVHLKVDLSSAKASIEALNTNFAAHVTNKIETQKLNASGKWGLITAIITGIIGFVSAVVIAYLTMKKG